MALEDRIGAFRTRVERWLRYLRHGVLPGLYHSMIEHPAHGILEHEAEDAEDAFMLACFPDAFGIPSPVSYYTAELLPHLEDEFEAWQRRLWDRGTLIERKGEQFHF